MQGSQGSPAPIVKEDTATVGKIKRIANIRSHLYDQVGKAKSLRERLGGTSPETAAPNGKPSEVPNGLLAEMDSELEALENLQSQLMGHLGAIDHML